MILNYNGCKLLTFTQKIEETLSTRLCSEPTIIKVFNKTISQQKQKSHNTKSMIQLYINLFIIKTKENFKIGTLFSTLREEIIKNKKNKKIKKGGKKPLWNKI